MDVRETESESELQEDPVLLSAVVEEDLFFKIDGIREEGRGRFLLLLAVLVVAETKPLADVGRRIIVVAGRK